ncbi:hypothetical protein M9Y10_041749 [Tritrichomonas musculus]|uniref:Uncharacterized protein n=1 Tax=Tritrichomonas musculus TaxID=1915356 RepID=A0ABR2K5U0_9EUKA
MNQNVEILLNEMAKPITQINKDNVFGIMPHIDASDPEDAPMIFFLIDTLFDYASGRESPITMKELIKSILGNVTLLPALYQRNIVSDHQDPELDQMISFINSFKQKNFK